MSDGKPCAFADCPKAAETAGFCKYHYECERRARSGVACSTPNCDRPVLARGLCSRCYPKRHPPRRARREVTCEHCGKTVAKTRDRDGRFCTAQCAQAFRGVRYATEPDANETYRAAECVVCGMGFWTVVANCVTCSTECQERLSARRRGKAKALRRSRYSAARIGDVDPHLVFESDGYRCHLCGCLTLRDQKVPHPKAPTIDHVVPLALGGTHEMANVRTACFLCNSRKGARGGGEQFAMFPTHP